MEEDDCVDDDDCAEEEEDASGAEVLAPACPAASVAEFVRTVAAPTSTSGCWSTKRLGRRKPKVSAAKSAVAMPLPTAEGASG